MAGRRRPAKLDDIESYNKDDVDSTRELHDWLEQQRAELEAAARAAAAPGAVVVDAPTRRSTAAQAVEQELTDRLQAAGHELLGDLVGWHRREDRPAWWEVYRLQDLDAEELERRRHGAGRAVGAAYLRPEKRSHLYEYSFPVQDTKLSDGRRGARRGHREEGRGRSSSSTPRPGGWC